jgi:hypothetical protein
MARTKKKRVLSPKVGTGLSKAFLTSNSPTTNRIVFDKEDPTVSVQFFVTPNRFKEYKNHNFSEDGQWQYVPCAGEGCPCCEHEDDEIRKKGDRFITNVYDVRNKQVRFLDGPKTMGTMIHYRWLKRGAKAKANFLKTVFDITKYPTSPVTYGIDRSDEDPVLLTKKKQGDEIEELRRKMIAYYGDRMEVGPDTLSDDDELEDEDLEEDEDEDEEEEIYTATELQKMKIAELKAICKELKIKPIPTGKDSLMDAIIEAQSEDEDDEDLEDDDDEEGWDEDEDDDEDEEEEEPPARKRRTTTKPKRRR